MPGKRFGPIRNAYIASRQLFDDRVIRYLFKRINKKLPKILDLGCGTGISTRQIAEQKHVNVIGCDIDPLMILAANEVGDFIKYVIAPSFKIPFPDKVFDAVTAFSSFHWFTDNQSMDEIKRVLKDNGIFFIVNKNDIAGFRVGYREKLEFLLTKRLRTVKKNYHPELILKRNGFVNLLKETFVTKEFFSLDTAVKHIQSAHIWNKVPELKRKDAEELLKRHVIDSMIDNKIFRVIDNQIISGIKSS